MADEAKTRTAGDIRTVRKISSLRELESLEPVWNDLVEQTAYPTIFQTFEWITAWWEAFGSDHALYVLAVEYGAHPVGLAPLMLTESGGFGRRRKVIRFIGTPQADYGDFIGSDKKLIIETTLAYLRTNRGDWTEIDLAELSERSDTVGLLRESLAADSMPHLIRESETCHSFIYDGNDADRQAFDPGKSKRLRRSINWFTRRGSLELEEVREPGELELLMPEFFHTHVVRWTDTFRPSMFLQADHRAFYRALVRRLSPQGRISFFVLRFEGTPIAYEFNFLYRNRSGHYTIAHDILHHTRSVGRIINHQIRDYYVRHGLEELDFSRGAHEYKDSLSNRSYTNYQVRMFSSRRALRQARWYGNFKATRLVQGLLQNKSFSFNRQRFSWLRHTYGLKGLTMMGMARAVRKLIDVRTVCVLGQSGTPVAVEPGLELEFARLDSSHQDEIASFVGAINESQHYRDLAERLAGATDCFAARHHGRIVALGWGLRRRDTDPETGFSLEPDHKQVLLSGGFTSPVVRGLGIRPWLMARQLDFYRSQGLTCIAAVAKSNAASLRVMRKMSFEQVAVFRSVRLFGRRIFSRRTARVSFP